MLARGTAFGGLPSAWPHQHCTGQSSTHISHRLRCPHTPRLPVLAAWQQYSPRKYSPQWSALPSQSPGDVNLTSGETNLSTAASYRSVPLDVNEFQAMGFISPEPGSVVGSQQQQEKVSPLLGMGALSWPHRPAAQQQQHMPLGVMDGRHNGGLHLEEEGLSAVDVNTPAPDAVNEQASSTGRAADMQRTNNGKQAAGLGLNMAITPQADLLDADGKGHSRISTLQPAYSNSAGASHSHNHDADVAALRRAEDALSKAGLSLDDFEKLQSNRPAGHLPGLLRAVRNIVIVVAVAVVLLASHAFGILVQWGSAVLGAAAIAYWGYRRGALSYSGALAAAFVGAGTLSCSLRLGFTLVAFFFSSTRLTAYKQELKMALDESTKAGGQRDWVQVFCNGLVPTLVAIAYGILAGCVDVPLGVLPTLETGRARLITALMGGFLGYYACCCGDTWASELGPLSREPPRLITTGQQVQKGTNGGVTLLGLSASILGGMFIGLVFYVAGILSPTLWVFERQQTLAMAQWRLIPLGLMAGLFGSALDSLLGATLQFSGRNLTTGRVCSTPGPDVEPISGTPLLTNNTVNLLSASTTASLTALAAMHMFGF